MNSNLVRGWGGGGGGRGKQETVMLKAKRFSKTLYYSAKPCIQLFSLHNYLLLWFATFLKHLPKKLA